ncbi:MAG TPA: right-handed parallel beta-helix repeat-containing protein, partial [Thermoplasmata archaeon]|nr:right-handed parallel beta-helix repeat-containing protein [Thermoplasmata archaeon]
MGAGSAFLTVGSDGDGGVQLRQPDYTGTLLTDLTALSYSTYVSTFMGCQAPYLILGMDTDEDGLVDDALFFEPCYQTAAYGGDPVPAQGAPVLNTWQSWNALGGGWWNINAGTFGPPLTTIASYGAAHPGARITNREDGAGGVRVAAGYGAGAWDNFVGNVDSFTIGVGAVATTYDFEPGAGPAHLDIGSDGVSDFDFPTIQGAVNAASGGDTVRVDAGTYPEVVVVSKSITLLGAQVGVSGCGRSSSFESVVGTPNGAFQILANNVVIDGFTITGVDGGSGSSSLGAGVWTTGTNSGHTIRNNIIAGNTIGVYLNSDGTSPSRVRDNAFDSNNVAGPGAGNAIYSDQGANDVTIRDNCFTGHDNAAMLFAGGAWLGNTQSGITVRDNSFDNDAGGIVTWFASDLTITGNTWRDSLGTSVFLGGDVSDVSITGNTFDSADFRGIRILAGAIGVDTTPDTDVVVNLNSFLDNTLEGLRVDTGSYTGTLDATCNWWGDVSGPFASTNPAGLGDDISDPDGVVNFVPWLGSPTPNPCSGPVHLDIGSTGTPYEVNFGMIQPAVSAANTGDTVYVDAGVYEEQVVIDTGIRLLPTVAGSLPTIRAPPFAGRSTFTIPSSGRTWDAIVEVKADGASIEGFVIDGFGRGGFCSGRSFTGIMMHGGTGMAAIGNTVTGIRDSPFSGCQAGIGIAMYADTVGDPTTGDITGNEVLDYQKGGIVVNIEGTVATVDGNHVVGVGPTHVIAQNGIQFGFGAGG